MGQAHAAADRTHAPMLAQIRAIFAHSWIARISAAVLAVAFGAWGIQGALTGGGPGAQEVASVPGGGSVSLADFAAEFDRSLAQEAQSLAGNGGGPADPSSVPPPLRREVGEAVLRRLVTAQVLAARAHAIGLTVPDAVVRDSIFAIPAFKGPDGQFDRQRFDDVLRANRLTEAEVLRLVRSEILEAGMLDPIRAPAVMPAAVVRTLFDYAAEQRTASIVTVRTADMAAPAPPDEATLHRFFLNHRSMFTVPEFRHVRVVVLSPETVGRDMTVSDADIRAAYDAAEGRLHKPARRSVQVAILPDAQRAQAVAAFWQAGGGWPAVQALAGKDGGTATALTDAGEKEFPSALLGTAVFAATPGSVTGPVREELGGFAVFRVTAATAASGDLASVRGQLRDEIAAQRATALIPDRVDRLQDAIAGGGLDKIPADLGAEAAAGTLDAQGMTAEGTPAPLPASGALRNAIVARAFSTDKGTPAQLVQGPAGSNGWYAVAVDDITPGHERAFADARADVLRAWTEAAQRHEANERATAIYTAAAASHTLAGAGLSVDHPAPFHRGGGAPGVPAALVPVLFTLHTGEATMAAVPDGFAVAVLGAIDHPPPSAAQASYDRLANEAREALGNDIGLAYAAALSQANPPRVNEAAFSRAIGP